MFLVNAATFAAVIAVIAGLARRPGTATRCRASTSARRSGPAAATSPPARRCGSSWSGRRLFIFFASAVWALLPLTARSALHLGSGGYGLLLGSVGVGAVAGAALLPRLRARLSPDAMLAAGSLGLAVVTLVLAFGHVTAVAAVALAVGGACWILALSTLNSLYQLSLPQWIKARGMSFYLVVFQGGNAIGSAVMGVAAEHAGLSPTLAIAAAGLALGPLAGAALAVPADPARGPAARPATGPRRSWPAAPA